MRRIAMVMALLVSAGTTHAQSNADEARAWCLGRDSTSAERRMAGCSWIIRAGRADTRTMAEAFSNRGNLRRAQRDLAGAIADYGEAIRLDPQSAESYRGRGIARGLQRDWNAASADFSAAIRLEPRYAGGYHARGIVAHEQGDLAQALADFNEAIRLDPDYGPYRDRGAVRRDQGDLAGARADFDAALRIHASDSFALANRCVTRFRQNDALALADCDAAIAAGPAHYGWPNAARAGIHLLQGDLAATAADLEEALRRDQQDAYALFLRSRLLARRGDAAGAARDADAARALDARVEVRLIGEFGAAIAR